VTLPPATAAGNLWLGIETDSAGHVPEQIETNNVSFATLPTVAQARLNLELAVSEIAEDAQPPGFQVTVWRNGDLAVRTPQGRDVILALAEPGALTHFGEFAFDGRLAVVRHDATGKITSVAMMDGSALHCGKQPLLDIGGRRIHYVECAPGPGVSPAGVTVAENLRVTDLRWPEEPK
jgi:hypothetical protein